MDTSQLHGYLSHMPQPHLPQLLEIRSCLPRSIIFAQVTIVAMATVLYGCPQANQTADLTLRETPSAKPSAPVTSHTSDIPIATHASDPKNSLNPVVSTTSSIPSKAELATLASHRSLQVKVATDIPTYDTLEATIAELEDSIEVWVSVYPISPVEPTPDSRNYHTHVSAERFETFWQDLQALNIADLSDATANSPNPENPGELRWVSDAPTYWFNVQDTTQSVEHQFNVYGPRSVDDSRYQAIVETFQAFLETALGKNLATL